MRSASRILGQECAELLGAVLQEKEFLDRAGKRTKKSIDKDQTYTVSWLSIINKVILSDQPVSRTSYPGMASWPMSAASTQRTNTWSK